MLGRSKSGCSLNCRSTSATISMAASPTDWGWRGWRWEGREGEFRGGEEKWVKGGEGR